MAASNPKGIIFFAALFPQFLSTTAALPGQLVILATTFLLIDGLWQLAYASGGSGLWRWLKSADKIAAINRLSGGALIVANLLLAGNRIREDIV